MVNFYKLNGDILTGAKLNAAVKSASVAAFGHSVVAEAQKRYFTAKIQGEKSPSMKDLVKVIHGELGVEDLGPVNV